MTMIIKPEFLNTSSVESIQTTRLGGQSSKPYESLNLGVFGEDINANLNLKYLKNLPHNPVFMQQIHGSRVVQYHQRPEHHGQEKADACFTYEKNTICTVLTADCLPVLISDKNATVVAAVHCGWRGLYENILAKTLAKLAVDADDLSCWLGPCISYKPYRVDAEFRKKFVLQNREFAHCFYLDKRKTWHADLKKIAVTQLQNLDVNHITQSPYCTYENKNLFYSYRRDGETGRMASMIWLT